MRLRIIFFLVGFLGLLVGVDGLLHGPWYRALLGFAWFAFYAYIAWKGPVPPRLQAWFAREMAGAQEIHRSWPLIVAGVLFALLCVAVAGLFLFADWAVLMDLFSSKRQNFPGALASLGGEWFARIVIAGIALGAAYAAFFTAYVRYRTD